MKLSLLIQEIGERFVQENFRRLQRHLTEENPFEGFRVISVAFDSAETKRVPHGLGFTPLDAIVLSKDSISVEVTLNFPLFSATEISASSNGKVKVRLLVGAARSAS